MIDIIRNEIKRIPLGFVFTANDIKFTVENPKLVSVVLSKMVANNEIRKLSKGRFYKTETGKFGELPLSDYEIVKDYLVKNGKTIGYLTGYKVFNELSLTTQVPAVLQIGTIKEKKNTKRLYYRINFVKQWNNITKENIPLLQLLDCLRFFKTIPDTTPDKAYIRLLQLFKELDCNQISRIKRLAAKYNPQTIALLGATLEILNPQENTKLLFEKLNPMTTYKLSISNNILPNQKKWNIL